MISLIFAARDEQAVILFIIRRLALLPDNV
ncbi:hypothetical protein DZA65_02409 [Dickeya dianthicola]|nr:hypothetical protein DZA65_02409 [Dickeya dianthicola]